MADASQIAEVRANTNVTETDSVFTGTVIGLLIDAGSVNSASAIIWRRKAAVYAELVDVTEAGASHAFSDLQDKALKMAAQFDSLAIISGSAGRPKIRTIERAQRH